VEPLSCLKKRGTACDRGQTLNPSLPLSTLSTLDLPGSNFCISFNFLEIYCRRKGSIYPHRKPLKDPSRTSWRVFLLNRHWFKCRAPYNDRLAFGKAYRNGVSCPRVPQSLNSGARTILGFSFQVVKFPPTVHTSHPNCLFGTELSSRPAHSDGTLNESNRRPRSISRVSIHKDLLVSHISRILLHIQAR
jgi:hypothetical protein